MVSSISPAHEDVENEFVTWELFWREFQQRCLRKEDVGTCQGVYFTFDKKWKEGLLD